MTPEQFLDTVKRDNETALSRLGSSKSLYAETSGEMEPEPMLEAAATAERHAAETFEAWADTEADARAVDCWKATAAQEREHYEAVLGRIDGEHTPGEPSAMQATLRETTTTVERVGAFLGRTLAADQSNAQLTGFFVGQADPQTASLFRGFGDDLESQQESGLDLLESVCSDDSEYEAARATADATIQAAYEEYTDSLEALGVNPKPVC